MGGTPVYLRARVRTRYPARIIPRAAGGRRFRQAAGPQAAHPQTGQGPVLRPPRPAGAGRNGGAGQPPAGVRRIAINGANTAFLAYAQHLDAGGYELEVGAFFDHVS